MNIRKFRTITKRLQIIALLEEAGSLVEGVIWQPTSDKRVIFPIESLVVNGSKEELILKTSSNFEFNNSMPVYVSIAHKGLISKLPPKTFKYSEDKLTCSYPSEARAHELRSEPRNLVSSKTELTITMTYAGLLANGDTKFTIRDFSHGGIGLIAAEGSRNFFIKNMNIIIKNIGSQVLGEQILAQVSYVANNPSKKGEIKVGLAFKKPLTDDQYKKIFEKIPTEA